MPGRGQLPPTPSLLEGQNLCALMLLCDSISQSPSVFSSKWLIVGLKCPHQIHLNTQCSVGGGVDCPYPHSYGPVTRMKAVRFDAFVWQHQPISILFLVKMRLVEWMVLLETRKAPFKSFSWNEVPLKVDCRLLYKVSACYMALWELAWRTLI